MAEFFTHISEGSGEKMGQLLSTAGAATSGIVIGLACCPYYALCLLAYLPFATIIMTRMQKYVMKSIFAKFGMNHVLGGFTEELLSGLKLTISFGMEKLKL